MNPKACPGDFIVASFPWRQRGILAEGNVMLVIPRNLVESRASRIACVRVQCFPPPKFAQRLAQLLRATILVVISSDEDVLAEASRLQQAGQRFALITIVRTAGSTPRHPGAKMIVREGGELFGTIGGGRIELTLVEDAKSALAEGKPRIVRHHLTHELAMCCGGEVEAFIEPLGRRETLILVGGGHINAALAPIGARIGFELVVADEMEEFATKARFPGARLFHSWDPREWAVGFDRDAYVVIATRDHAVDQDVLERLAALGAAPAYLGVVGSRGKLGRFRRRLEARGIAASWIETVRGPIGVDVGAETPEEIAVAIAAELIAVRRRAPSPRVA